jgi:triosephosphate isomerase
MHWEDAGAFTGEIAPGFLVELGCRFVLVGHSERRALFGETDADCNRKLKAALRARLVPVLCVGESLAEREAGTTEAVIERQLAGGLAAVDAEDSFVLAYEPVWAIGTGRTATPQQAGAVHVHIRNWLKGHFATGTAECTRILYGGSVGPDTVDALMCDPDVDGALVGGASLDAARFARIVRFAAPRPAAGFGA